MEYTVDYFIKKFSKLTDKEVGPGMVQNHCAYWHCGVRDDYKATPEAQALSDLLDKLKEKPLKLRDSTLSWTVIDINDLGPAGKARERILDALKKVKKLNK